MSAIMQAIAGQGIEAVWRGAEPPDAVDITQAFIETLIDGLPRLNYCEGETNTIDVAQLAADFATIKAASDEQAIRDAKEAEIKALALSRMGARLPALANFDTVDLIVTLVQEGALNTPAPGGDLDACKDIYQYAKARIIDARTKPIAQVEAYDPAADGNFPS